ncbi:GNAT family N-acetyltransferase [Ketogulonicigenium vulgare]|uniref:GNAT family N-acetyltransferase n=1 Tax=Ketogulonicigenium vulgare TaxID=92945 RepID=UPI0023587983|nr:GNAT family N-acetyltransferase [Ketogulonicigenium vulgare]
MQKPRAAPDFQIIAGFPPDQRDRVAALYWQAFGRKLRPVLAPRAMAHRFLHIALRPDHAISAVTPDGRVLGVVGFCSADGALVYDHGLALLQTYGARSARWRVKVLRHLLRDEAPAPDAFQMDGLFVDPAARGFGIGSQLLQAFADEGRRRGYRIARLEVANTNARACQLYARHGYLAVQTAGIGGLRWLFGYRSTTTMELVL